MLFSAYSFITKVEIVSQQSGHAFFVRSHGCALFIFIEKKGCFVYEME